LKATGSAGGLSTDTPDTMEITGGAAPLRANVVADASKVQMLPETTTEPSAAAPLGEGDLRLVDEGPIDSLSEPPLPSTMATPPAGEPLEPRIAADAEQQTPRPLPAAKPEVLDVPSPQQARLMLRKYRQMSDGALAHELAISSGFDARTIQQALRERNLPTAAGPSASLSRGRTSDVERRLLEQVSRLTPDRGRQLLRDLISDSGEEAEVRLHALALLATSGDPQLAAIARERAMQDADPRVAELATRIIREQDGRKK
jgi:hypothetical protein